MARVTYLLGAGASAGSLPTVDKFTSSLWDVIGKLRGVLEYKTQAYGQSNSFRYPDSINSAIGDLTRLYFGCLSHRSVDTFMKKMYLISDDGIDNEEYKRMKASIVLFFEIFRFYKGNESDMRYDAFLATVLRKEAPYLPGDINILSWNYDYEFERAYTKYYNADINGVHESLNVLHKNSKYQKSISNSFGILKINGTAGFYDKDGAIILGLNSVNVYKTSFMDTRASEFENLYPMLEVYYEYVYAKKGEYVPAISFAWEDDYGIVKMKDEIEKALRNTEIIIAIGYSFPYFNREMDAHIIKCFKNYAKGKVYVQAPQDDVGELIENVKEFRENWVIEEKTSFYLNRYETKFIAKTGLNQFYMSF